MSENDEPLPRYRAGGLGGYVCGSCGSGRRWEYLAPPYTHGRCLCGFDGPTVRTARFARPTRLDTPETVDKSARQRGLVSFYGVRERVDK